jgi:predicted negative regulator of RcsB-dependent stress response
MSTELNDLEQSERAKQWLKDNSRAIAFGLGMGVLALVGWRWYEEREIAQRADAASRFQAISQSITDKKLDQAQTQLNSFAEELPKAGYLPLAKLAVAGMAVQNLKLDDAEKLLRDAMNSSSGETQSVARVRLARLLVGRGKHDEALTLVAAEKDAKFEGLMLEVKGDALVAQKKSSEARVAYQQSLDKLEANSGNRTGVEMKLADLAVATEPQKS